MSENKILSGLEINTDVIEKMVNDETMNISLFFGQEVQEVERLFRQI